MANENTFYFNPTILNLPRKVKNFYDESRYKNHEEELAKNEESNCTLNFAKEIIFNRIHQIRINAIQGIIERNKYTNQSSENVSLSAGSDSEVKIMPQIEIVEKSNNLMLQDSQSASSDEDSEGSKKLVSTSTQNNVTKKATITQITPDSQKTSYVQQSQTYVSPINGTTTTTTTTTIFTNYVENVKEFPSIDQLHNPENEISVTDQTEFQQTFLKETNKYRSMHGCPPLKLNKELCNLAEEWANKCADTNTLQHRSNSMYGENLYAAQGMTVDGRMPVKSWYDEIVNYNYNNPVFASNTGHFTQVVWKNSKEVGVGFTVRGRSTFVVANYNPPGNYRGQFRENVLRKKK